MGWRTKKKWLKWNSDCNRIRDELLYLRTIWGLSVKALKFAVIALVAIGFCSVAKADSTGNDPKMKLGPGGGSIVLQQDNFSFNFTKTDATQTSVTFDFINATQATIVMMDLNVSGSGLAFSCDNSIDPYFNSCSPTQSTAGPTTISYFGLDATHLGIPSASLVICENYPAQPCQTVIPEASDFALTVDVTDMQVGQSFGAQGLLIAPEPASVLLIVAGAILFAFWKRKTLVTVA